MREKKTRITSNFSETMNTRQYSEIFNVEKRNINLEFSTLWNYLPKGETFLDKQKSRELVVNRPNLQKMLT